MLANILYAINMNTYTIDQIKKKNQITFDKHLIYAHQTTIVHFFKTENYAINWLLVSVTTNSTLTQYISKNNLIDSIQHDKFLTPINNIVRKPRLPNININTPKKKLTAQLFIKKWKNLKIYFFKKITTLKYFRIQNMLLNKKTEPKAHILNKKFGYITIWSKQPNPSLYKNLKKHTLTYLKHQYQKTQTNFSLLESVKLQQQDEHTKLSSLLFFYKNIIYSSNIKFIKTINNDRKLTPNQTTLNYQQDKQIYKIVNKKIKNISTQFIFKENLPIINIFLIRKINSKTFQSIYHLYKLKCMLQSKQKNKQQLPEKRTIYKIKQTLLKWLFLYNQYDIYRNINYFGTPLSFLKGCTLNVYTGTKWDITANQTTKQQLFNLYTDLQVKKSNLIINNYTPINLWNFYKYLNTTPAALIISLQQIYPINVNRYKNFFAFFLLQFLENFLKKKIWIKINTQYKHTLFWKNFLKNSTTANYNFSKYTIKNLFNRDILELLLITFQTQDLQFFLRFIKLVLESNHFKKHRKILSIVFEIIRKHKILFTLTPVKGFSFDIRGKVGVSGNAKKRHLFFSYGKITSTTQNIRSQWQQISIWTPTGQMGVTCLIQY